MESKTVRDVLVEYYNRKNKVIDDQAGGLLSRVQTKSEFDIISKQAETEIRAIVRAEVIEELRGKRFSVQGGTDTEQRYVVDWQDIESCEGKGE